MYAAVSSRGKNLATTVSSDAGFTLQTLLTEKHLVLHLMGFPPLGLNLYKDELCPGGEDE